MNIAICVILAMLAAAFSFEFARRKTTQNKNKKSPASFQSADEADPTTSGRYRALRVKEAMQKKSSGVNPAAGGNLKRPSAPASASRTINHEKVEKVAEQKLPDPFEHKV